MGRALSALLVAFVGLAPAATTPRQIVYSAGGKLWVIREDGTGKRRLTTHTIPESQPEYSRDGKKIAFVSRVGKNEELFVMNADGTGVRRLTKARGSDGQPTWSPDGRQIAFTSNRSGQWKVYVMNSNGTGTRLLTPTASLVGDDAPAWSPDGLWIAFHSTRVKDGNGEVFKMHPDGTGVTRLTFTDCPREVCPDDSFPAWSPDGKEIVYSSQRAGKTHGLLIMLASGRDLRQVTYTPAFDDWRARWSRDGKKIVFWAVPQRGSYVYTVNADGSGLRRVTAGSYPVWWP
jgi:TolB protein